MDIAVAPGQKQHFVETASRRSAMSVADAKLPALLEQSKLWAIGVCDKAKSAKERLQHSAYLELRRVSCDCHKGVLTLRGRVPNYHLKQLAQSLLSEMEGIQELNNQLVVTHNKEVDDVGINAKKW
jgi:hypothetical protein